MDDESLRIDDNNSAVVWYSPNSRTVGDDEVLFTIEVEARRNLSLKEVLSIHSELLSAEAYKGQDFDHYELALEITDDISTFEVLQNQPNPFKDITRIPIVMTNAGTVFVSIHDSQGKLLYTKEKSFDKGRHFLDINSDDIQVEGILFYTVTNGQQSVTKQMLRIKT